VYWTQNICELELCHSKREGKIGRARGSKMPEALSLLLAVCPSAVWPPKCVFVMMSLVMDVGKLLPDNMTPRRQSV
jgi:hypothetical protein